MYVLHVPVSYFFTVARAKSAFENLKKRYFKKRCEFKKSQKSGTSWEEVEKAEAELRQFSFLTWLCRFIRLRETKSNVDEVNSQNSFDISSQEHTLDIERSDEEDAEEDADYVIEDEGNELARSEKPTSDSVYFDESVRPS